MRPIPLMLAIMPMVEAFQRYVLETAIPDDPSSYERMHAWLRELAEGFRKLRVKDPGNDAFKIDPDVARTYGVPVRDAHREAVMAARAKAPTTPTASDATATGRGPGTQRTKTNDPSIDVTVPRPDGAIAMPSPSGAANQKPITPARPSGTPDPTTKDTVASNGKDLTAQETQDAVEETKEAKARKKKRERRKAILAQKKGLGR